MGILEIVLPVAVSFVITVIAGKLLIPALVRLKAGQSIKEIGPTWHMTKQGTPTMGGLMFVLTTCLAAAVLTGNWYGQWDFTLALIGVSLLTMLVGFVDDYIKVVKKRNLGLIWWQKVVAQVVISLAFSWYCYKHPMIGSSVIVPFFNVEWDLGAFYVPLMTLAMIFMVNSANLQDGLDGLLSSVSVIGSSAWGLIAVFVTLAGASALSPEYIGNYQHLAIFAMALAGGCMGFLRFNHYPALVFMGDTGSMFIGGAMVGMSMLLRMPLYWLLICFTMFASSMSVIIQRIYFKVTHGKRIFKMSPIHHHFELSGMTEQQIVAMYSVVEGLLCLIALFSLPLN